MPPAEVSTPIQDGGYDLPRFAFRTPPELAGQKPGRYPVVVVGGGLTGLAAACDLALRGIPVVLLDDDDTVGVRGAASRGICYARKTLETFERLGIYQRVAARGVTWSVGRVLRNDQELYSFDLGAGAETCQPPFINIQQFHVEWALVDRLAELPGAQLRWLSRVTGAQAAADHIRLSVETPAGTYALEAEWVVDASGVGSRLREALGVTVRPSLGVDRWCISDVRFPAAERPPERHVWVEAAFNEGRAVWQHPMADGVWRIDYQMAPDAEPAEISNPEAVRRRLAAHLGVQTPVELVWVGPWAYRSFVLDRFRHGRVLFAGDAAHCFSPFGARGGNSGVQDAENLAWKLAAVLRGDAPEALLDSYDAERRPAAVQNVEVTDRSARFLAPRSRFENALRGAVLDLARRHAFARPLVNAGRMSVPFDYTGLSPLCTNAGEALPNLPAMLADGRATSLVALRAGAAPVPWLLAWPGAPPLPDAPGFAVGGPVGPLPVLRGTALEALGGPGTVLVVRPDLHLAARLSHPGPAEVAAAMSRALALAGEHRMNATMRGAA